MVQGGEIDNAIVFAPEIAAIEEYFGVDRNRFLQTDRYGDDKPFQTLRHNKGGGCYFYNRGKCAIYAVRPLDCRLFPFDIIEDDEGTLRWIVYTNLCPVNLDYRIAYDQVRALFDLSEKDARLYCEAQADGMERNSFIKLDRVY